MLVRRHNPAASPRRGVILMVVLAMLTLFAIVGVSFVLYADAAAASARVKREAEGKIGPDMDPEQAFNLFLGQFIYDVHDNAEGVTSSLRGHSLVRGIYGYNNTAGATNAVPYNGTGRLHYPLQVGPAGIQGTDEYLLVNYLYFASDGFLHDPERPGGRANLAAARPAWVGGFNAPYTYADLNSFYLAAVKANGTVLARSFHRDWLFNPGTTINDPKNPNWTNPVGKYLTLRPRPQEHPGFPFPEDAGGDVKNLIGSPGFLAGYDAKGNPILANNDSIWIDIGAPVMTAPDGRKYKMLVAPLVMDLDGRINLNTAGNISGREAASSHMSHHGWGATEVSLAQLMAGSKNPLEWRNLFLGNPPQANPVAFGKYGPNFLPNAGNGNLTQNVPLTTAHFYAPWDTDAKNETGGNGYSSVVTLQTKATNPTNCFPLFAAGYGNGTTGIGAKGEFHNHPLRFNATRANRWASGNNNDDWVFGVTDMEALLRYGDTGSPALTSPLLRLCPINFANNALPLTGAYPRNLVTTYSFDVNAPGVLPYINFSDPNYSYAMTSGIQPPAGNGVAFPAVPTPNGATLPALNGQTQPGGQPPAPNPAGFSEFGADRRAAEMALMGAATASVLSKIDLNRTLRAYPTQSPNVRYDINAASLTAAGNAQADRQALANDIYRRLLAVTGVLTPKNPAAPTSAELAPRRYLAQLAVNMVDYIDEDEISTPFNFYTAADVTALGGTAANFNVADVSVPNDATNEAVPKYWVFGTELPRVVLNEVLAQFPNPSLVQGTNADNIKIWVELYNTLLQPAGNTTTNIQAADAQAVQLVMPQQNGAPNPNPYSVYNLTVSNALDLRPQLNENVLGKPAIFTRPAGSAAGATNLPLTEDFTSPWSPLGQPVPAPVPPPAMAPGSYFLITPKTAATAPKYVDPLNPDPTKVPSITTVPAKTPVMLSPALDYSPGYPAPAAGAAAPNPPDERQTGVAVFLRRLANPHLPPNTAIIANGAINPLYNPYVTVDYIDKVPLVSAVPGQTPNGAPLASRGKTQPYAGLTLVKPVAGGNPPYDPYTLQAPVAPATQSPSPVANQLPATGANGTLFHTFGQVNAPLPQTLHYDWLVHLDRQLISPMELLHVSGFAPYQLTQFFMVGDNSSAANKFQHYVPWFDPGNFAKPATTNRLYRIFEFLATHDRAQGRTTAAGLMQPRTPGLVNINTVYDQEILLALCDPNPSNWINNQAPVLQMFNNMIASRTPNKGIPGQTYAEGTPANGVTLDRPFRSLATGWVAANTPNQPAGQNPQVQYPNGLLGIQETLLRSLTPTTSTAPLLFQNPADPTTTPTDPVHPYLQYEMLTKIYNNLTVRSNTFAVWVTVGFFEVTNANTQPPTLGAEIGRSEGRQVRHRMFAILDRSAPALANTPGPQARFDPRNHPNVVLHYSIIE